jgi:hypothetical protein
VDRDFALFDCDETYMAPEAIAHHAHRQAPARDEASMMNDFHDSIVMVCLIDRNTCVLHARLEVTSSNPYTAHAHNSREKSCDL